MSEVPDRHQEFYIDVERMRNGELSADEFWTTHRTSLEAWASWVVNRYGYDGVTVEDTLQAGFMELLERTGVVESYSSNGKSRNWDPDRGNAASLARYVRWNVGTAMQRAHATVLGRPSKTRGRPVIRHYPLYSVTTGSPSPRQWREHDQFVSESVPGDRGGSAAIEWVDSAMATAKTPREVWGIAFYFAAAAKGYQYEEIEDVATSSPDYDFTKRQYRALLTRAGVGALVFGTRRGKSVKMDRRNDGVEIIDAETIEAMVAGDRISDDEEIDTVVARIGAIYDTTASSMLRLAALLAQVKDEGIWKRGGKYANFNDFLKNGVEFGGEVAKSTAYALIAAYREAVKLAAEPDIGMGVAEIWRVWGRSKLNLVAGAPGEVRAELIKAGNQGASRSTLERLIADAKTHKELNDASGDDDVSGSGVDSEPRDPDAGTTETLNIRFRVPRDRTIYVSAHDVNGDRANFEPHRINEAFFTYEAPGGQILQIHPETTPGGDLAKLALQWSERGRDGIH